MRSRVLLLALLATAVSCSALPVAGAGAATPIESFATLPSTTEAGGHPDVAFSFKVSNQQYAPDPCSCKQDAKNIVVNLPTGLIGNPHSTPQCTIAEFASEECPVDSQVGLVEAFFSDTAGNGGLTEGSFLAPVFVLQPPPGRVALFAFKTLFFTPDFISIDDRTDSDYGIEATVTAIDHFTPLSFARTVFWGVPASPVHDFLRWGFAQGTYALNSTCDREDNRSTDDPATVYGWCRESGSVKPIGSAPGGPGGPVSSSSPEIPFFQNPTVCGATSLATSLDILSYDKGESHADSPYPATSDCGQLTFNPSQAIAPTTTAADSPSGAEFRLTVPQFESPTVPSPSELRGADVTLPPGFALAPNVMNGKTTCSDAEARFGTREAAQCPENSKIGTIVVESPVLPGPLPGGAYLGEPQPGNRYRLFLVFDGFGVHAKIAGTIEPDPQTGQIQLHFKDLPQAPFETFVMHIFGSERGPLATPTKCGTYQVKSVFTPWDASLSPQTSLQFFTVDQGPGGGPCPGATRPFSPGFQAASTANTAGAHTDFWVNLTREDGDQNVAGLTVKTPPGFSADLSGVPYCPQAAIEQLANPLYPGTGELGGATACPAASRIGSVTAAVGAGTHPLYLPGKVYLAGPYAGAPLSLEVVIPAVAGPYDLGNVAVRAAAHVDPETAQITTVSDPFPQVVGGIPVRARQIFIHLDRQGFALNPTDCDPLSVGATVAGDEGATSTLSQHFQVANCASLRFAPRLSLKLTGSTKQAGNPALTATLTARPGEANISRAQVTLPGTELIDNAHINSPCTRVQFNEGKTPGEKCPPGSILGSAKAETPLLEKPLEGPIYFRSTGRAGLPDVVAVLNGQIDIVLDGHVDSLHGRLRTTFETVPDAPVRRVVLRFDGGRRGLLENSPHLCSHPFHATAMISAQNGKTANQNPVLGTPCRKHKRGGRKRALRHHHRKGVS